MKPPHRRRILNLAGSAAAVLAFPRAAMTQAYPTRPVRIVVGFPPGGAVDFHARLIGKWLSERLGQPFVVENRPGAGGNVGTETVVRAPADGYTLLLTAVPDAINATLYQRLNFNFLRDITPIAGIVLGPQVIVLHPSLAIKTVADFIAYAKANPGKLDMASGGNGTPGHVAGELFKIMTGIGMQHVPYRGEGPALADMVSGQVKVMFVSLAPSIELIRAGKLRAMAVTTATRSPALPDVAAIGETVAGYEAAGWAGMAAPKGTPPDIIETLNREVNAGLANPDIKARYTEMGYTLFSGSADEFGKFMAADTEKWGKVIRTANIKVE